MNATQVPKINDSSLLRKQGIFYMSQPVQNTSRMVFMFPGHGAQYANMLFQLRQHDSTVKEIFDRVDRAYANIAGETLSQRMFHIHDEALATKNINLPEVMQPAIFATGIALFHYLQQRGFNALCHIGHSLGEITALAASGVISIEDGIFITYHRAMALNQIAPAERGGMLAVNLHPQDAVMATLLKNHETQLTCSLHNTPQQTVISGPSNLLELIETQCRALNVGCTRLKVSHAFHSNLMRPAVQYYRDKLRTIKFNLPTTQILSTISGDYYQPAHITTDYMPEFLASQLVTPFSFNDLIEKLYKEKQIYSFIEVGPKNILTGLVDGILQQREFVAIASDVPSLEIGQSLLRLLAYLNVNYQPLEDQKLDTQNALIPKKETALSIQQEDDFISSLLKYAVNAYDELKITRKTGEITITLRRQATHLEANQNYVHESEYRDVHDVHKEEPSQPTPNQSKQPQVAEVKVTPSNSHNPVSPSSTISTPPIIVSAFTPSINNTADIRAFVYQIFEEKTGYTVDILEPNLDLEADLGIDSVKQGEIIGIIKQHYALLEDIKVDTKLLNTINKIIAWLEENVAPVPQNNAVTQVSTTVSIDEIATIVFAIFEAKTGYTRDILDPELDLEADLGIDSVKQGEVIGLITDKLELPKQEAKIVGLNTISKVIAWFSSQIATGMATTAVDLSQPSPIATAITTSPSALPIMATTVVGVDKIKSHLLGIVKYHTGYPELLIELTTPLYQGLAINKILIQAIIDDFATQYTIAKDKLPALDQINLMDLIQAISSGTDGSTAEKKTEQLNFITDIAGKIKALYTGPCATKRHISITIEKPLVPSGQTYSLAGKSFVVFGDNDDGNITRELCALLAAQHAVYAVISDNYMAAYSDAIVCKFNDPASLQQGMLESLRKLPHVDGIINLYPLMRQFSVFATTVEEWNRLLDSNFNVLFYSVRSVYDTWMDSNHTPGFFCLSNIGNIFGFENGNSTNPLGMLCSGFAKSLRKEMPNVVTKVIDFTTTSDIGKLLQLAMAEFATVDLPLEVGYSANYKRKVIQVIPEPIDTVVKMPHLYLNARDVVIFSGGGRGIIYECAMGLATIFNATVVLTGRTPFPTGNEPWVKMTAEEFSKYKPEFLKKRRLESPQSKPIALEYEYDALVNTRFMYENILNCQKQGLRVFYTQWDVNSAEETQRVFADISKKYGPITGVVHGAGLGSFGNINKKPAEHTISVVRTKARGYYNILQNVDVNKLKFFCSFGSISGRYGMDGQVDYTAGAAIVSTLTHLFKTRYPNIKIFNIGWTAWREVGMAASDRVRSIQEGTRGLTFLSSDEGRQKFVEELVYGGTAGEVLVVGSLGSNSPMGHYDIIVGTEKTVLETAMDGIIFNRKKYPLLQKVVFRQADVAITCSKDVHLTEDLHLLDHKVNQAPVMAGVFHIEAYLETIRIMGGFGTHIPVEQVNYCVKNIVFDKFIKAFSANPLTLLYHASLKGTVPGGKEYAVKITSDFVNATGKILEKDRLHSKGTVIIYDAPQLAPNPVIQDIYSVVHTAPQVNLATFYNSASSIIIFGQSFRFIEQAWFLSDTEMVGLNRVPRDNGLFSYTTNPDLLASPILLDCSGRLNLFMEFQKNGHIIVPRSIGEMVQYRPMPAYGEKIYTYAKLTQQQGDLVHFDMQIFDEKHVYINVIDTIMIKLGRVESDYNIVQKG